MFGKKHAILCSSAWMFGVLGDGYTPSHSIALFHLCKRRSLFYAWIWHDRYIKHSSALSWAQLSPKLSSAAPAAWLLPEGGTKLLVNRSAEAGPAKNLGLQPSFAQLPTLKRCQKRRSNYNVFIPMLNFPLKIEFVIKTDWKHEHFLCFKQVHTFKALQGINKILIQSCLVTKIIYENLKKQKSRMQNLNQI